MTKAKKIQLALYIDWVLIMIFSMVLSTEFSTAILLVLISPFVGVIIVIAEHYANTRTD